MLKLYENIRRLREEKNISQETLAKLTGYTNRSSIAKIEKGLVDLSQSKIELFARVLNTAPSALTGWTDTPSGHMSTENISNIERRHIPLLGEIACGIPILAEENTTSVYAQCMDQFAADFCLKCKGDSMINARIFDGDIVFIKRQSVVENGEIAAVIIDNEATLKRIAYYPDKNMLILKAENPAYSDLIYTGNELDSIRVIGKAVAFQSMIK